MILNVDLHEVYTAYLAGIAPVDHGGFIEWEGRKIKVLDLESKKYIIIKHGTKYYFCDGKLHREGGPAVIVRTGMQRWYKNDRLHRDNGPAIIGKATKRYYKNGQLHREDGPAITGSNITNEYWLYNQCYYTFEEWNKQVNKIKERKNGTK